MKKINISKIFAMLALASLFTSCNDDEDVTPIVNIAKPTMTISVAPTATVSEGGSVPFTLTLSEPVGEDFNFYVVYQNSSTADGADSTVEEALGTTFQQTFTIPAFTTTYNGTIDIYEDELTEGNETLVLSVGDTRTTAVNLTPATTTITIVNSVSNKVVLDFNFDRTFTGSNGYSNTLCNVTTGSPAEHYDIDFLLWDENFNDTGNVDAQTGACVESMTIDLDDPSLTDGLYHVISALYTNAGLDFAIGQFPLVGTGDFNIPITVDYLRAGSINKGTFTQESPNWFTASTPVGTLAQVVDVNITTVSPGVRKVDIQNTLNTTVVASGKTKLFTKGNYVSKHKK